MKVLNVYLTELIHKALKLKCVEEGVSMTKYIVRLIESDLKLNGDSK